MIGDTISTWIRSILEWIEATGIQDAISDVIADASIEALLALIALAVAAIGSLVIGGIILAILAVIAIVVLVVIIVTYILHSIGLMRIAKKLEVKHRLLAWIPYGRAYLLGACAEKSMQRSGQRTWRWGMILLFTSLALGIGRPILQLAVTIILSLLPMLSVTINVILGCSSLILICMTGYCLWCIFKEYMNNVLAVVLAVFGALSGGLLAMMLLILSFCKMRPAKKQEDDWDEFSDEFSDEVSGEVSDEVSADANTVSAQ